MRGTIARIEGQRTADAPAPAALGHAAIDAAIGGGLARGRLHELFAQQPEDAGAVAGFATMLALLALPPGAPLLWLRQDEAERGAGRLHPPGLAEIGLDPSRLVLVVLPDPVALLRAAAEVVRCPQVGVAVIEPWRRPRALDLTASRRLAVAAEASGVTALMLRADAEPGPSAAQTRWSVAAAASAALEAGAPGHPTFDLELLRQRSGPAGGRWRLEWDRERVRFREPSLPRAVPAVAAGGSFPGDAPRYAG
ncbi:ImuA family protein [Sphingomonas sp. PR090111-T3T-6A]|uniref:ImuA family protein n=1 Tax=Sphingomonas sp. PR090111-T3T-6A TaxID=685778 RepID=UPI001F2BDD70|nr:hypothetical protein [Sphingomonas sp. PR090111-T3T-6A]